MIKDIYVKDGWYNNNILTLLRNDNKEIPIDLKHVERRFTWYYNDTEEPTVDPDDPTVDPGTDPIDPDPQNPGDDPITPDPQPETPNIYNVHVQQYNTAQGFVNCSDRVEEGQDLTITVYPTGVYEIDTFTVNGVAITQNPYTVYNVHSDITIAVTFKAKQTPNPDQPTDPDPQTPDPQPVITYVVTWNVGDEGTIKIHDVIQNNVGSITQQKGYSVLAQVTPNYGYSINKFIVNGNEMYVPLPNSSGTYDLYIQNVQSNTYFEVTFKQKIVDDSGLPSINIEYDQDSVGGTITAEYSQHDDGNYITILIYPETDYEIKRLFIDGTDCTKYILNNKYIYKVPEQINKDSIDIVVKFGEFYNYRSGILHTVGNGSVSVFTNTFGGLDNVSQGSYYFQTERRPIRIEFYPNEGNALSTFTINGINHLDEVQNGIFDITEIPYVTIQVEVQFAKTNLGICNVIGDRSYIDSRYVSCGVRANVSEQYTNGCIVEQGANVIIKPAVSSLLTLRRFSINGVETQIPYFGNGEYIYEPVDEDITIIPICDVGMDTSIPTGTWVPLHDLPIGTEILAIGRDLNGETSPVGNYIEIIIENEVMLYLYHDNRAEVLERNKMLGTYDPNLKFRDMFIIPTTITINGQELDIHVQTLCTPMKLTKFEDNVVHAYYGLVKNN